MFFDWADSQPWQDRNNPVLIIEALSRELKEIYAAELVCRYSAHYESSHWYNSKRIWKHNELERLVKETYHHGRTSNYVA